MMIIIPLYTYEQHTDFADTYVEGLSTSFKISFTSPGTLKVTISDSSFGEKSFYGVYPGLPKLDNKEIKDILLDMPMKNEENVIFGQWFRDDQLKLWMVEKTHDGHWYGVFDTYLSEYQVKYLHGFVVDFIQEGRINPLKLVDLSENPTCFTPEINSAIAGDDGRINISYRGNETAAIISDATTIKRPLCVDVEQHIIDNLDDAIDSKVINRLSNVLGTVDYDYLKTILKDSVEPNENEEEKGTVNKMANLFGDLKVGKASNKYSLTYFGTVAYLGKTYYNGKIYDASGMTINFDMLYFVPSAEVKAGDIIEKDNKGYYVLGVNNGVVKAVDLFAGTEENLVPGGPFGMTMYSKLFNPMGNMSGENAFGNMLMMQALMGDGAKDSGNNSLLLAMMMMQGGFKFPTLEMPDLTKANAEKK